MAHKIDAAADHGLDAFIFDWYWYEDGPFLERCLNEGFLGAANNERLKFALMWANHDWTDIHPAALNGVGEKARLLYPGKVSLATVNAVAEYASERYFTHPSYWRIDDRPYFSIYDLPTFVEGVGGVSEAREAIAFFRQRVREIAQVDVHMNVVLWNRGVLAGEETVPNAADLTTYLGFDSITSYVWVHHGVLDTFPITDYGEIRDKYMAYWAETDEIYSSPYYPNVTMGWDTSPRTVQSDKYINARYPFMPMIGGNSPERFKAALEMVRDKLMEKPENERILTINAWNEWTEGSYLEPDTIHGNAYLETIKSVFD